MSGFLAVGVVVGGPAGMRPNYKGIKDRKKFDVFGARSNMDG